MRPVASVRGAIALLGVWLLSACVSPSPNTATPAETPFSKPAAVRMFASALAAIEDRYIAPLPVAELGIEGLRGLTTLEPNLTVVREDGRIVARLADRGAAKTDPPRAGGARAWGILIHDMIAGLRPQSEKLRAHRAEDLYQAVIDGMMTKLDTVSRYAGAEEAELNRAERDGYGGIGIRFIVEDHLTRITQVHPFGPAETAGLLAGDVITTVDDIDLSGLETGHVRDLLRGHDGTSVRLHLRRNGSPLAAVVKRRRVIPPTVSARMAGDIVILTLSAFNSRTALEVQREYRRLATAARARLRGMVVDLRGNRGGLLNQAVTVADLFLDGGRIVTVDGRHPDSHQIYDAKPAVIAGHMPLVVLIDGETASAAEVLAAALQDHRRALVLGTASYGKGSVQTVVALPNHGELTLTWARLKSPRGQTIDGRGLIPTVCLDRAALAPDRAGTMKRIAERLPRGFVNLEKWRTDPDALVLRVQCPPADRSGFAALDIAVRTVADPLIMAALRRPGPAIQSAKVPPEKEIP